MKVKMRAIEKTYYDGHDILPGQEFYMDERDNDISTLIAMGKLEKVPPREPPPPPYVPPGQDWSLAAAEREGDSEVGAEGDIGEKGNMGEVPPPE